MKTTKLKSRESSFHFYFSFRRRVSRPSVTKHGNSKYHLIPRTPTTSTGIDSSITDEIWTSANEAKFFRTSTTSTGIGSSLNLHENNRSLESRDADFYSTDIEDSKDTYRRFFPNTPTTSGLGSSSDRQSVETRRGSKDLPDHLWAAAMEDGFSRFNAMKSLQTITRQPRPNHDWVKTERISRFTKHRTIGQSPQREEEIWTSKLNESNVVSTYATQRMNGPHKCHHQTRRSFSTSIVADLAVTPDGSQQSLGSGEFLVSFLCDSSLDVVSRCCAAVLRRRTNGCVPFRVYNFEERITYRVYFRIRFVTRTTTFTFLFTFRICRVLIYVIIRVLLLRVRTERIVDR